ncbi:MAG: preQ(1) synthase [Kiritimatiellia bacterium]
MAKNEKIKGLTQLGTKSRQPQSPDEARLETFDNRYPKSNYWIRFQTSEFTSLCPITGQPDFGTVTIEYIPGRKCIESKSLKLYLASFRNHGSFAESITNRIRDDILKACRPKKLKVTTDFTARGGITMRVIAEHPEPK